MYSSIFDCSTSIESDFDLNSTTKSGHSGGNSSLSLSVKASQRDFFTQARSGDLFAPFGRRNPVDESKPIPVLSFSTQVLNSPINVKLRLPVSPPVGGIIMRSPSLVRSNRKSWFN